MADEHEVTPFDERPANRRPNPGWFRKGEPGPALKHGHRSALVLTGRLPDGAVVAAFEAREREVLDGIGGEDVYGPLGVDEVRRYVRLEAIYGSVLAQVLHGGVFTAKGATRAAVGLLMQLDGKLERKAAMLGIRRAPAPVKSFQELMAMSREEIDAERQQARAPRPSADGDDLPSGGRSRAPDGDGRDGDDEPEPEE